LEIYIPPGPRLGDIVIELVGVSKGYGERLLIDDLSCSIPPGSIVGVIGPNGAGKTTLLRLVTGQEQPDEGKIRMGETVELAYVDQPRDTLDWEKSVWEEISGGEETLDPGRAAQQLTRLCFQLQLPRLRPAEEGGDRSRAASATACIWRRC
jgi:energy-dependent translational throttle protein EttA